MQTFLPYPDFYASAMVLDKKRCWKQVVEARQIIDVLLGKSVGWANHPAVKMWAGYLPALKYYFNVFLDVSKHHHGIKTSYHPYWSIVGKISSGKTLEMPWFMGNTDFHRAMRARLIEKDEAFYIQKFPHDKGFNDGLYFWPEPETKTFRIIKP